MNAQKADVQKHYQSPTGVIQTFERRPIPPHSPSPLGVCYFPSNLGEEDNVISNKLGRHIIAEPALSRLSFVDINEFLSKTKNSTFPSERKERRTDVDGL